jgi:hypothetical protein
MSTFRWLDVAHGWASWELQGGAGRYRCTVSDTSDVFRDVLVAAILLLSGSRDVNVSFDLEPKQVQWKISETRGGVSLHAEAFERWGKGHGALRWEGAWVNAEEFGHEMANAMNILLDTYGDAELRWRWPSYPIPRSELERLEGLLADRGT